ncbi:Hypothetical protein MELLADRAFT_89283 [Melampsora larici-populina 98AG31]|uniref:AB hydrolase-1 domain-containing protein n=1 Tax=Melampsora larici-populina (strain 98AG31 / pathotype 3-4-7) TaxID=747676 RepID=F4R5L5_MELLP|nr:Hypothetical protein MELLADRAFT_89283 [Melampsora larici-populina 98AG31]EGG12068.1 Hypothetical protein MELLADRAFT_89283 [Melampsora larici-populina 98AG31]
MAHGIINRNPFSRPKIRDFQPSTEPQDFTGSTNSTLNGTFIQPIIPTDAHFSVSEAQLSTALACVGGPRPTGKPGGVILLVHGTYSAPSIVWFESAYVKVLPNLTPTYDVCYVALPGFALDDIQISAEYVAYSIMTLAKQANSGKVMIVSHSQGGLGVQWALTFWPSTHNLVEFFVSLAGDFKGSTLAKLVCLIRCPIALSQQRSDSKFIAALNSQNDTFSGAVARVPTFSFFTTADDVVKPQSPGPKASSNLTGSYAIPIQSFCGKNYDLKHVGMTKDATIYNMVLDVIINKSFDPSRINMICRLPKTNGGSLTSLPSSNSSSRSTNQEPELQPYVCARRYATQCKT